MPDDNKRNLQYFEALSMNELFGLIQNWQYENKKRFLSLSVQKDRDKFCCIALTNPSEVIITNGYEPYREWGGNGAQVSGGALKVSS